MFSLVLAALSADSRMILGLLVNAIPDHSHKFLNVRTCDQVQIRFDGHHDGDDVIILIDIMMILVM